MIHDSVLGTIGQTPLVRLNAVTRALNVAVAAKVEFFNPGGSVKDRIAVGMIDAAEQDGSLKPGGTIIEGTSGNTGAGLAIVAISRGYRCIFTTTDKQSQEKIDVLRAFGAEVIVCPTAVAPDDPRSYYSVARRLATEIPNSVYLNQYDNPANAQAHYLATGPEIWEQTGGKVTHYFAGAGTGGSISGTARYLKEQNPDVKVIGVDPMGSVYHKYFHTGEFDHDEIYPYLTEGVGEDILAENMDFQIVDDYVQVTDKAAMQMTRRLAKEEGLFIGQSCGMAVAGMLDWIESHQDEMGDDALVVVMLPDSGFRYLSKTYNDAWMKGHGFLEAPDTPTAGQVLTDGEEHRLRVVSPSDRVADAVATMQEFGVSQLPVVDDGEPVGSLSEKALLAALIADAGVASGRVGDVMDAPFAVVASSARLDRMMPHLESAGAVLVETGDGLRILTRSDAVAALARRTLVA